MADADSPNTSPASRRSPHKGRADKELRILEAVLAILGRDGISGVSMRAVARRAGVALGLVNYYFEDKTALVAAALRRIGDQDSEIIRPPADLDPTGRLRFALHRVADAELLDSDYLALRLHLWSLAMAEPRYASINQQAQGHYLRGLRSLLAAARPDLDGDEIARRAADILIIQNGIWLTTLLVPDRESIERSVRRCEEIAFAP